MSCRLAPAAALLAALAVSQAGASERAFGAFAPLVAVGTHAVADDEGLTTITGRVRGPLYGETDTAPEEVGLLVCAFELRLDSSSLAEEGSATCAFEGREPGARLQARFGCEGTLGEGCVGDFVITAGFGAYQGATGGGRATLSVRERIYGLADDNTLTETLYGLAHWERFVLRLP